MPTEHRFEYFIGDRKIDVLASSLSLRQINDHIKHDYGRRYDRYIAPAPKPKKTKRRKQPTQANRPIQPALPALVSERAQARASAPVSERAQAQASAPASAPASAQGQAYAQQKYFCMGCGMELHPLYGETPSIICVNCREK